MADPTGTVADPTGPVAEQPPPAPAVLAEREDAVAVVRLNRPDRRNALTTDTMHDLVDALAAADADPQVRAIVLTGGSQTFASGADVRELLALDTARYLDSPRVGAWRRIMSVGTPLVAAVAGPVLGGGCELALACDLVVAADNAVFGQPEIRLGIMPGAGGTQRWARVAGRFVAAEVVLLGRTVDAWRARDLGLVHRVAPRERVVQVGVEVARELAGFGPIATRQARAAVRATEETPLSAGLDLERAMLAGLLGTADRTEGITAFLDKRPPRFQGR
ncbi:enoyl-CoA hydratase-related protein [Solwaraspora sp. WMMD792]|uniref:enoyl-CoA hydratase-related protein n=1 Tax=Solwaraspora sp. WMMD792 TaxID=3016099 RepID=UPI002415DF03|nr:enoyl-CoA hydratase-related protein [Solwaraspora sp. WMMD792]MDG4771037.1 enoyl-CoA hydratase-related protein [Solwaraspora sp. WMMD792]